MKSEEFIDIIDFLRNCDLAYAFKKKRLRYIQLATVSREIKNLRDGFFWIWNREGGRYRLKDPWISRKSIDILAGLFGKVDEAAALLDIDLAIVDLDRKRFRQFLDARVSSGRGRRHLYDLYCGEGESMRTLATLRVPYLQRYIPTMSKFDIDDVNSLLLDEADLESLMHIASRFHDIEMNLSRDMDIYPQFMRDFRRMYREGATVDIVGYGEISTVMRLSRKGWIGNAVDVVSDDSQWIWKKMPPFPSIEEVLRYEESYKDYRTILVTEIGIDVPEQEIRHFRHGSYYVVYAGQKRMDEGNICNKVIHHLDEENACQLLKLVLDRLQRVHKFNEGPGGVRVGFDAQLSNWVFSPAEKTMDRVGPEDSLTYIDTSSPLIRINGMEQINTEIFIKSAASFLRPLIRIFFLKDVVDRYYDIRRVVIDVIANMHKEQCVGLIDRFIETANDFFVTTGIDMKPITRGEIDGYYSSDAFIWKFYQSARIIDRFITEKLLRKKYIFRIPGPIAR
ncbi:MAG: hypothetical protein E4G96_04420 [Chrysiogenales bacterium]|nr:MAG: hypothetical protein E4G96_04420 [Chrysiogenales bacterium]